MVKHSTLLTLLVLSVSNIPGQNCRETSKWIVELWEFRSFQPESGDGTITLDNLGCKKTKDSKCCVNINGRLNKQVSSINVIKGAIAAYRDPDCKMSNFVRKFLRGSYPDLGPINWGNKISSIGDPLPEKWAVELFEHRNYQPTTGDGRLLLDNFNCVETPGNVCCKDVTGRMDDKTSSLRVQANAINAYREKGCTTRSFIGKFVKGTEYADFKHTTYNDGISSVGDPSSPVWDVQFFEHRDRKPLEGRGYLPLNSNGCTKTKDNPCCKDITGFLNDRISSIFVVDGAINAYDSPGCVKTSFIARFVKGADYLDLKKTGGNDKISSVGDPIPN